MAVGEALKINVREAATLTASADALRTALGSPA
jgi:hypothetical protein